MTKAKRKTFIVISSVLMILLAMGLYLRFYNTKDRAKMVMGGQFQKQPTEKEEHNITSPKTDNEKYFRPSKLDILNNKNFDYKFFDLFSEKDASKNTLPEYFLKTPEGTIINYFSILREAENLDENKMGGCGTIGNAKYPYPVAYAFLSSNYKGKLSYEKYLKSFKNIAHLNLIKLKRIPFDLNYPTSLRYFIEIETIEGTDKDSTYFAYYYAYIYLSQEGNQYKIENIDFYGEDFLCAAYHGWAHNAEASVLIRYGDWCSLVKKLHPTKQEGYVKKIYFEGTDGNEYLIEFITLTNDTDIETAQYRKTQDGKWEFIRLNPEKCLEEKKKTSQ